MDGFENWRAPHGAATVPTHSSEHAPASCNTVEAYPGPALGGSCERGSSLRSVGSHQHEGEAATLGRDAVSCFATTGIEDILLVVALGHSLQRSESLLAALPREVMQDHLARHVRRLFDESLRERGLVTPVQQVQVATPPRPMRTSLTLPRDVSRRPPKLVRRPRVCEPFATAPRTALKLCDFGCWSDEDAGVSRRRLDEDCERVLKGWVPSRSSASAWHPTCGSEAS
jgi:hypothetical protein